MLVKLNSKTGIDFMPNTLYRGCYMFSHSFTYDNATMIMAVKLKNDSDRAHPFNNGGAWYPMTDTLYESFYTSDYTDWGGRSGFPYTPDVNKLNIYAVSADKKLGTKCYIYDNSLVKLADLTYFNNLLNMNHYLGGSMGGSENSNYFILGEMSIFNYAMTETELSSYMAALKTKWA